MTLPPPGAGGWPEQGGGQMEHTDGTYRRRKSMGGRILGVDEDRGGLATCWRLGWRPLRPPPIPNLILGWDAFRNPLLGARRVQLVRRQ